MPSRCTSGRHALSKSVNVPGLIRRVVIPAKYSSIVASSRTGASVAVGTTTGGGPFLRLFLVLAGHRRSAAPAGTWEHASCRRRPATSGERAHGGMTVRSPGWQAHGFHPCRRRFPLASWPGLPPVAVSGVTLARRPGTADGPWGLRREAVPPGCRRAAKCARRAARAGRQLTDTAATRPAGGPGGETLELRARSGSRRRWHPPAPG